MQELKERIVACERCPRLIAHCRKVAEVKRAAYRGETYWGKPVPSFGDPEAQLLIVGLAPGAHGANRTGRMFTGDRSGDFLYAALHAAGFASQPTATHREDGLRLNNAYITAPCHCAPPDNKPLPEELAACRPYLEEELRGLRRVKVVLCLGRIALENYLKAAGRGPASHYPFGHGAHFAGAPQVLCSYHPSQQNTQTRRLTMAMMIAVLEKARSLI
ncbi:MAG: type-5 uracil-DNA glycosylase [Bryobacter sp.]